MSKAKLTVKTPIKTTKTKEIMTADDYSHMELREYIYFRPDTYAGSEDKNDREEWLLVAADEDSVDKDSGSPSPQSVSSDSEIGEELPTNEIIIEQKVESKNKLRMSKRFISLPEVIDNIFNEILSNAADNIIKSTGTKFAGSAIEITMDSKTITIKNGGIPMPVEIHPETKVHVPEMVFGILNSSSNYNDSEERKVSGRNGVGAKLTNIFSKEFSIIVADSVRQKIYKQTWRENMTQKDQPIIDEYEGDPYVQVTYTLDFARFKYEEYPDEAVNLFARYAADVSFTCKTPVYFNGLEFKYFTWQEYGQLYFQDKIENCLVHYQWPEDVKTKIVRGLEMAADKHVLPYVELYILDTPDAGDTISFVNGRMSKEGGVHVNACLKELTTNLLTAMNNDTSKLTTRTKTIKKISRSASQLTKVKPKEAPKEDTIKLTAKDVKDHVTIILSCFLVNPKYKTQNKSCLSSPTPKFKIPVERFNIVKSWKLIVRLNNELRAKELLLLKKSDAGGKLLSKLEKGEHANWAGGQKRMECTLCVTEGDSGAAFAIHMISAMEETNGMGKNLMGYIPLRGKVLNCMKASAGKQSDNQILNRVKKMLGLDDLVDYTIDENYKKLNYGSVLIMTDADDDGKHITGLLLNFFYVRFLSLLRRGCIALLRTPVIRLTRGKEVRKFYTIADYKEWQNNDPEAKFNWDVKYCKGLGSSNAQEIREDFTDLRKVKFLYDDSTPEVMSLAFHKDCADARKRWISEWEKTLKISTSEMIPISEFMENEFIEYSVVNLRRAIPHIMDGFKPSQRKVLWGCLLKWSSGNKPINGLGRNNKRSKLGQLSSFIEGETQYHHGPTSMQGTIVKMTQDFVGSNNLRYLVPDALLGSRNLGGKDAVQARYAFTYPDWWLSYVFRKEDVSLLNILNEDGENIEPEFMLPILPLQLINGTNGIATGSSTRIPNCNPIDVINCLRALITNKEMPPLIPWYRGFKGTIEIVKQDPRIAKEKSLIEKRVTQYQDGLTDNILTPEEMATQIQLENRENPRNPIPNEIPEVHDIDEDVKDDINIPEEFKLDVTNTFGNRGIQDQYAVITTGKFNISGNKIVVTELPIGLWTHDYWSFLHNLRCERQIMSFTDHSTTESVKFEILGFKDPTITTLRLQTKISMSNMVLLSCEGHPIRYNTLYDILRIFYNLRLPYYSKRKEYLLQRFTEDMKKKTDKMRFIQAYIDKKIRIKNRNDTEVLKKLEELNLPVNMLNTALKSLTKEKIAELQSEIDREQQIYKILETKTPEQLWLDDLDEFEQEYSKHYNADGSAKIVKRHMKKRKGKEKVEQSEEPEEAEESIEESDNEEENIEE